ncbi:MAG TPA: hypothetical protein VE954_07475 [Oligoflexus sp.]|uniref:hypothetical protein n=1 Tax=Oligoflexus sp. TaxID=1971216 RepID=UPI002D558F17|nr:hypothetical protein [Oligoflexus sp.]HYX32939.1 hypothetical protein [Oligoflexus sp.]
MSNLALLEYIHRINNAPALEQLETVAEELRRADILAGMHSDLAPDVLTEKMRNEWLLGRFLVIMDRKSYDMITPWLNQAIAILIGERKPKA